MTARVLDGAAIAQAIRGEVAPSVASFTARAGRPPGLGIVLVGDDPASDIYVRGKLKSAGEAGLRADLQRLSASARLEDLLALVEQLNHSDAHDGILVQSPLPAAMGPDAERRVFDAVRPDQDVDGLPPVNVGRLATVTICHSRTPNLADVASQADILVAAIGRAAFVTNAFVKPGAAVVDVGTTQVTDRAIVERLFPAGSKRREAFARRGAIVVGDVHPEVAEIAGALSPVPGGVGPLTIAMLLKNTVVAAQSRAERTRGWVGGERRHGRERRVGAR